MADLSLTDHADVSRRAESLRPTSGHDKVAAPAPTAAAGRDDPRAHHGGWTVSGAANRSRAAGRGAGTVRAGSPRGDFLHPVIRGVRRTRVGACQGRTLLKSADNRRDGGRVRNRRAQFRRPSRLGGGRYRAAAVRALVAPLRRVRVSACSASSALIVVGVIASWYAGHVEARPPSATRRTRPRTLRPAAMRPQMPAGCFLQRRGARRPYEPVITETGGECGKSGRPSARETSRHRKRE